MTTTRLTGARPRWPECERSAAGAWDSAAVAAAPPVLRPAIETRHLIYHCCPIATNDGWRSNVRELVKRWGVFNGRRIVAVVQGDGCLPAREVQEAFPSPGGIEWLLWPNDKRLREVATFLPLLQCVSSLNPDEATFYAHTKGNSTLGTTDGRMDDAKRIRGAARWRNAMYEHLLGKADRCMEALRRHAAVCTTKIVWPADRPFRYPSGLRHGRFMPAGTFFWFRHDQIFTRPNWQQVPQDRYGAEAWLGGVIAPEEALSVFQPWSENTFPPSSPYDPKHYPAAFDEEVLV